MIRLIALFLALTFAVLAVGPALEANVSAGDLADVVVRLTCPRAAEPIPAPLPR